MNNENEKAWNKIYGKKQQAVASPIEPVVSSDLAKQEKYFEESLHEVLSFWADAYVFHGGEKMKGYEYFIDRAQGKIVFKVRTEGGIKSC